MTSFFRFLLLSIGLSFGSVVSGSAQDSIQIEVTSSIDQKISHILEVKRSNCEKNAGEFKIVDRTDRFPDQKTITEIAVDLDANIEKITIIDESGFVCSDNSASYYCGSAGCRLHLVSSTDYLSLVVQGWEIIQNSYGDLIFLGALHGSFCNELGMVPCFNTIYFHGGKFVYKK